ncbi:hypothetical protein R84981_001578 [Carnimonas sp. R-84981]|uniref:hypothetical protein n=1 Tax=Carnimonas bestiolae TaxID=3402172 RepID=UPI003EDCAB33
MGRQPVVLDTDDSVAVLEGETRVSLSQAWRECVRFGSRFSSYRQQVARATAGLPCVREQGALFMGSGDFHHLSLALVERCIKDYGFSESNGLRLVVLDNHPDNMRFPWGIHCGSWVAHAAKLTGIAHIHVIGITSGDLGAAHAWEHHLSALFKGRITYWCTGVNTRWASRIGLSQRFRQFDSEEALVAAAVSELSSDRTATYLSIDKDVFAPDVVRTNWDQGQMRREQFDALVAALSGTLVGSDVTGEISTWHYKAAWKRWLSAADGQDTGASHAELSEWQHQQALFNQHIVAILERAWRCN